jgi:two-component system sensor histidine kinase BaeS
MIRFFRRFLSIKFFISYFIVILVVIIVLATAAKFVIPNAFERHMEAMTAIMGEVAVSLEEDLFKNFNDAVNEALLIATSAALISAFIVSYFVSRQVVAPIHQLTAASQYIAKGHYDERVQTPGGASREDMDELAQLASSFNQMASKLEQAENLRRQLIGDIAHELRTPLSTIKGSMEGLIDGVLPAENETFQEVYKEADRLQRLVQDLQDLNRVEAGVVQLKPEPIPVKTLIETARSRLNRQFEEKGVSLSVDIPAPLPEVLVDEDRVGQVLLNLAGNALQYTPSGGQVKIAAHIQGDKMLITIADSGIGIDASHLPHIFTRFYRVDKSRSRAGGGSGIGLTIAKHLIEAHGGNIVAESSGVGKGSTFTITLPLI